MCSVKKSSLLPYSIFHVRRGNVAGGWKVVFGAEEHKCDGADKIFWRMIRKESALSTLLYK
jgi:hypothetical protein